MIPWRDHSFLKDEDDIQLLEDLEKAKEEPVTAKQYYELYPNSFDLNTEPPVVMFDNLDLGDADKNHVLLFFLSIGPFTTLLGGVIYKKWLSLIVMCSLLVGFGSLDIVLQTIEIIKNEDTSYPDADMVDETQRLMFLTTGMLMVLGALLLHLLCHVDN